MLPRYLNDPEGDFGSLYCRFLMHDEDGPLDPRCPFRTSPSTVDYEQRFFIAATIFSLTCATYILWECVRRLRAYMHHQRESQWLQERVEIAALQATYDDRDSWIPYLVERNRLILEEPARELERIYVERDALIHTILAMQVLPAEEEDDELDIVPQGAEVGEEYDSLRANRASPKAKSFDDEDNFIFVHPMPPREALKRSTATLRPVKDWSQVERRHKIVPQGEEMEEKEFRTSKHTRNKKNPSRYNMKEIRARRHKAVQKLITLVELKKAENPEGKIEPHGMTEDLFKFAGDLSRLATNIDLAEHDNIILHTERALLLAHGIVRSTSFMDFVAAILSYIHMYSKHSLTINATYIVKALQEEFNTDLSETDVEPNGWSGREVLDSWEMLKGHSMYKHITFLISAAMSSSVCSLKEIKWDFFGVRLIHVEAMKEQASAVSVLDCLINTFVWMSETGYWCFQEQSLAPLLFSDQRLRLYVNDCNELIGMKDTATAGNHPDLPAYERKLDDCLRTTGKMQGLSNSMAVKETLQRKYAALVVIKQDLIAKGKNTQFRFAPAGVVICGDSSIGKSQLAELTMKCGLTAMGFSDDKRGIITINEADKHDNTYTSDVVGVYIDDTGNVKAEFVDQAPTRKYITFFNNIAAQAVKAELNEKGCVFIQFKLGVLTTNIPDLDARKYSNYPDAILRRFLHVRARVKPEFQESGTSTSLNTDHPKLLAAKEGEIIDVWELDFLRYVPKEGFVPIKCVLDGEERECLNLTLREYILALTIKLKEHAEKQNKEVRKNKLLEDAKNCPVCNCPPCVSNPECKECFKPEPHGLISDVLEAADAVSRLKRLFSSYLFPVNLATSAYGTREIRQYVDEWSERNRPLIFATIPDSWWQSRAAQSLINRYVRNAAGADMLKAQKMLNAIFKLGVIPAAILGWAYFSLFILSFVLSYLVTESIIAPQAAQMRERLEADRRVLHDYGQQIRDRVKLGAVASVVLIGIGVALKAWYSGFQKEQHSIEGDIVEQDKAPGWMGAMMGKLGLSVKNSTIPLSPDPQHVVNKIRNNVGWGVFTSESFPKVQQCGLFSPRKSVIGFPEHMLHASSNMNLPRASEVSVKASFGKGPGGSFEFKINPELCYIVPNKDLVLARVQNSREFKNLYQYFPDEQPTGSCLAHLMVPSMHGEKEVVSISPKFKYTGHSYRKFEGAVYKSNKARKGACMSPLISESKHAGIMGVHIGGDSTRDIGVSQTITKKELDAAYAWLEEHDGPLSAHAGEIPEQQMDIDVLASTNIHPHSHARTLTHENAVVVIGSTKVRAEQKGNVVPNILEKSVRHVCNFDTQYASPDLRPNWKHFNLNIDQFSKPIGYFSPRLLRWAQDDWLNGLYPKMDRYVQECGQMKPLTMKESILGVPGVKYLDPMPMSTGMGFPIFGKKNKVDEQGEGIHFTEVREGEILIDRIPKPHVEKEFNRLIECWKDNVRAYPVTTATLKDEPTPVEKKKVRVFQAAPVAMSMAIRKYFLPIARFLHLHSLTAESAVGVNAFSRDWEELMEFATEYAPDNLALAWDYRFYDVSMNSQLTRTAWECFIKLAERGGYDEESLRIMRAMIVDICHPLLDINGTMYLAFNMNTSGNNMTVDVNGTVGSLLVRMGFKTVYPQCQNFRDCVRMMTYGDDFIGSCKKQFREFNFMTYKKFLADNGMEITLPDKSDREVFFLEADKLDFLKRVSEYIPEIDCKIGKLDEKSILKPLVANVKSNSVTPREVAASCVETALHEWFAYGRKHYEVRRAQMQEVCEEHNLEIPALNYTFDERVAFWKEKYDP